MQALGENVGAEAELARGADDPVAGFLAQAAVVVERFGGCADGDTGKPRDIADRDTEPPRIGRLSGEGGKSAPVRRRSLMRYPFTAPDMKPRT